MLYVWFYGQLKAGQVVYVYVGGMLMQKFVHLQAYWLSCTVAQQQKSFSNKHNENAITMQCTGGEYLSHLVCSPPVHGMVIVFLLCLLESLLSIFGHRK